MSGYGYEDNTRRPMGGKSTYFRRDDDLDTLWKNNTQTGINFNKYDNIEVDAKGDNIPKPISTFDEAGFNRLLTSNIKRAEYKVPTPVQKRAIPTIMAGRDIMACAQTGSGKTAAFLFPIINDLSKSNPSGKDGMAVTPQAVIMAPTRELVIQVYDEARKFCGGTKLMVKVVYGGTSVSEQLQSLNDGCNILVATPGRLNDFAERGRINFSCVKYLILDEADRMLDMGFMPQVKNCVFHRTMSKMRQTLMFSATFPPRVQNLASQFLHNFVFFVFGVLGGACSDVRQTFHDVTAKNKMDRNELLMEMLQEQSKRNKNEKTLIFVEQKKHADVLALFLCQEDLPATTIHGDRHQEEREMALSDFKSGRKPILIATSVAARGLDIKGVTHVVNFQLPSGRDGIEEYVHRIGRTGRVGNTGRATSFIDFNTDGDIINPLVKVLTDAKQPVPDWLAGGGSGGCGMGGRRYGGRGGY